MVYPIILNNNLYNPTNDILPCLISYWDKVWWSQFSMTLLAQLCNTWSKAIVLTWYPMARENFLEQIVGTNITMGDLHSKDDITHNIDKQVLFIESWNSELFIEILDNLPDKNERIIFIKNFDIFSNIVLEWYIHHPNIILSGDIDASPLKEKIAHTPYKTIIAFSQPETDIKWYTYSTQEKYHGCFMWQTDKWTIYIKTV